MKIILTQQEVQQLKNTTARILGEVSFDDSNVITVTSAENGNVEVSVAEGFVSDIISLIMTMTPVVKGVYTHVVSTLTLLRTLGEGLEAKWAKKTEEPKAQEVE